MNFSPNHAEIISDSTRAMSERNDMYDHTWAPGMPNWSRNRNR